MTVDGSVPVDRRDSLKLIFHFFVSALTSIKLQFSSKFLMVLKSRCHEDSKMLYIISESEWSPKICEF